MPTGTPTYTTIDPVTGAVGADFTGNIMAESLVLAAGDSSTPATEDTIQWVRQSDGALVAYILTATVGTQEDVLLLSAGAQDPLSQSALIELQADSRASGALAELAVSAGPGNTASLAAILFDGVSFFQSPLIMDGVGNSDFIQGSSRRRSQIGWGGAAFTWPGGQPASNQLILPHGLPFTPTCCVATGVGGGDFFLVNQYAFPDATNFYFWAWCVNTNPSAGQQFSFKWIAAAP